MSINVNQVQEFKNFFSGSEHNFGEFIYSTEESGKKIPGKGRTVTKKLITIEEYKLHLEGTKGLGIIPINESDECSFSVIDLDLYDEDLMRYVSAIERGKFPLVPFRSKSGGLHIYIFFKSSVPARRAIEIMRKFSAILSIDLLVQSRKKEAVEIFPKQTKLDKEKGSVGNWINLPYYNAKETKSYAYSKGNSLSLTEALGLIKEKRTTLQEVEEFLKTLEYSDAPPCLQQLYFLNPFDESSSRNNYLFSMGVYLKKKDEEFFEHQLMEVNRGLLVPLPDKEVEKTIVSSLKKKDYVYKCKENPCFEFCNKSECKKREFGIGKNEGYFSSIECGQLFQFKSSLPYYEWEVRSQGQQEFTRLRFKSEDEIIKQDAFLRLCMRELHELPSKLKQSEWFNKVNQALKEVQVIAVEAEDDTSPFIILKNLISDFLTGRALAETKDQIFAKRVYFEKGKGEYLFRVKDLTEYIYVTKQFRYYNPQDLHGILRELNCTYRKINTESRKQIRVACLSKVDFENYEISEIFHPDFSEMQDSDF